MLLKSIGIGMKFYSQVTTLEIVTYYLKGNRTVCGNDIVNAANLNGAISEAVDWLSYATIVESTISSTFQSCFPYFLLKKYSNFRRQKVSTILHFSSHDYLSVLDILPCNISTIREVHWRRNTRSNWAGSLSYTLRSQDSCPRPYVQQKALCVCSIWMQYSSIIHSACWCVQVHSTCKPH